MTRHPTLDPALRRLLVGVSLSALGNGMTLPLLVVYLHDVRGIPTATAGLVLAYLAVVQLVLVPAGGWLVDRIGPRPVLMAGLVVEAVGVALLATVHSTSQAFAVATVVAAGGSIVWAPQSALIGRMTTGSTRQRAFGVQFMLLNLGIGVGGLVSAAVVDVARPRTFEVLYLIDAATYLAYIAVLVTLRGGVGDGPSAGASADAADDRGGYREVARDRRLIRLSLVSLVLLTFGYGSLEIGVPVFTTQVAGLPVAWVGVAYAVNTFTIVAAQLVVLRWVDGRSRSRIMALVAVLWALCWVVVGSAGLVDGVLAGVAICLGVGVFAVGETLWSPVAPALLNDLAPDHLRGRYNAVGSLTWGITGALGPAVAGGLLGAGLPGLWVTLVAVGCLAAAGLALRLRRHLTPAEDGRRPTAGTASDAGARMGA